MGGLLLADSCSGRKARVEKKRARRIDWQVGPTHSRWAATGSAAPGENVIGCVEECRGDSVVFIVF